MSEKHTPGPWWVTDSGVRDRGGYICHTNKAQRYEGQEDRYQRETAERAANAVLIAVAPDMLKELHRLHEREYNPFEPDNQSETYARIGALIDKATRSAP